MKELAIGALGTVIGVGIMWAVGVFGKGQEAIADEAIKQAIRDVMTEQQAERKDEIEEVVKGALVIETPTGETTIGAQVLKNGQSIARVQGTVAAILGEQ